MESEESIEKQVWAYLDGTLPEPQKKIVEENISKKRAWKSAYENALFIHNNLINLPLEEPAHGFSEAVMVKVEAGARKKPQKNTIALATTIFLFSVCIIAFVFSAGKQTESEDGFVHHITLDLLREQNALFRQNVVYFLGGACVMLSLVILDALILRRPQKKWQVMSGE